jgi:hypothetical protein
MRLPKQPVMNLAELEQKLLAAARHAPPVEVVPAGFERRLMSRIVASRRADPWSELAGLLWRAVAPALGLTVALGVWAFTAGILTDPSPIDTEIESAVYAVIENGTEVW